ncbi:MAG: hypothetical protein ACREOF_04385 [Gemmatimonadales bacterium]
MPEPAVIYNSQRPEPAARFRSAAALVLRERGRRDRFFRFGVGLVVVVGAAALLAPWLAPHDPLVGDLQSAYLLEPGGRYPLGTDPQGRWTSSPSRSRSRSVCSSAWWRGITSDGSTPR